MEEKEYNQFIEDECIDENFAKNLWDVVKSSLTEIKIEDSETEDEMIVSIKLKLIGD